jgi:hypothetical protein
MEHLPLVGLLLDEFLHQLLTLAVLQHNNLNALLFQVSFPTYEGLVLAWRQSTVKVLAGRLQLTNDHSFHLVHDTSSSTHVAG